MALQPGHCLPFFESQGTTISVRYRSFQGKQSCAHPVAFSQPFHSFHGAQMFAQVMHILYFLTALFLQGQESERITPLVPLFQIIKPTLKWIPLTSPCRIGYSTYLTDFPSDLARKQMANMTIITLTMSFCRHHIN